MLGAVGGGSELAVVGSSAAEAALRYGIVSTRGHMRVVETERNGQGNQNGRGLPYEIEYTDIAGNPNQCDRDGCQYPQEPRGDARRNRAYSYDAEGNVPGVTDNSPPEEIVIATHGYTVTDEDFTSRSDGDFLYDLEEALDGLGYDYSYIGFSWDADFTTGNDSPIDNWANSFQFFTEDWIAALNGLKLAKFISWIRSEASETNIRLLGHSLGGRVLLHTLNILLYHFRERDAIQSVTLLGAAVPRRSINEEYEQWVRKERRERERDVPPYNILTNVGASYNHDYHNAIEQVVSGTVTNYWSAFDGALNVYTDNTITSGYYSSTFSLGGSGSLPEDATEDPLGGTPANFEDNDVSYVVWADHGAYLNRDVISRAVENWRDE